MNFFFFHKINIEIFDRITDASSFPTVNSPPVPLSPSNRAVCTLSPVSPIISTANTFDDTSKFPFKISRLVQTLKDTQDTKIFNGAISL